MSAPRNRARTGWNVKELADLLTMYAKDNPEAVVQFTSNGIGGRWPDGKVPMGIFIDHQVNLVDATRCGGGVTMGICLMEFRNQDDPK